MYLQRIYEISSPKKFADTLCDIKTPTKFVFLNINKASTSIKYPFLHQETEQIITKQQYWHPGRSDLIPGTRFCTYYPSV